MRFLIFVVLLFGVFFVSTATATVPCNNFSCELEGCAANCAFCELVAPAFDCSTVVDCTAPGETPEESKCWQKSEGCPLGGFCVHYLNSVLNPNCYPCSNSSQCVSGLCDSDDLTNKTCFECATCGAGAKRCSICDPTDCDDLCGASVQCDDKKVNSPICTASIETGFCDGYCSYRAGDGKCEVDCGPPADILCDEKASGDVCLACAGLNTSTLIKNSVCSKSCTCGGGTGVECNSSLNCYRDPSCGWYCNGNSKMWVATDPCACIPKSPCTADKDCCVGQPSSPYEACDVASGECIDCTAAIDSKGMCRTECGSDTECDNRAPNSVWEEGISCKKCDANCKYAECSTKCTLATPHTLEPGHSCIPGGCTGVAVPCPLLSLATDCWNITSPQFGCWWNASELGKCEGEAWPCNHSWLASSSTNCSNQVGCVWKFPDLEGSCAPTGTRVCDAAFCATSPSPNDHYDCGGTTYYCRHDTSMGWFWATDPKAGAEKTSEGNCLNFFDDDCDGKMDCADPDCTAGVAPCTCSNLPSPECTSPSDCSDICASVDPAKLTVRRGCTEYPDCLCSSGTSYVCSDSLTCRESPEPCGGAYYKCVKTGPGSVGWIKSSDVPSTETGLCADGLNNDCDFFTDCEDVDCQSTQDCIGAGPADLAVRQMKVTSPARESLVVQAVAEIDNYGPGKTNAYDVTFTVINPSTGAAVEVIDMDDPARAAVTKKTITVSKQLQGVTHIVPWNFMAPAEGQYIVKTEVIDANPGDPNNKFNVSMEVAGSAKPMTGPEYPLIALVLLIIAIPVIAYYLRKQKKDRGKPRKHIKE